MSDEALRRLERRFRETGGADDEAAVLRERVRAGVLDAKRLELAAHAGSEAARRALRLPARSTTLYHWVRGFVRCGHEASARVAIAAARAAYPRWARALHASVLHGDWVTQALRAAEAWARSPSPELAEAAADAGRLADEAEAEADDARVFPEVVVAAACGEAARAAWRGRRDHVWGAVAAARRVAGDAAVRAAITAELVPWALGDHDPLERRPT